MSRFKNIYACLVHEEKSSVIDLVRNLHFLDPDASILLYNGGSDPDLLRGFPFEQYGATVHPEPRPMKWGWLHDFAIDCMRFALATQSFDAITIVDSDQLAVKKGYSGFIGRVLQQDENIGMLGITDQKQGPGSMVDPVRAALPEKELWAPLLGQLPGGADSFLYWTFWPSTVFSRKACAALVDLFDHSAELKSILEKTEIWASEEVILPTLVAALGFKIAKNPCDNRYVKYRVNYRADDMEKAFEEAAVYWVHPVPRSPAHALRRQIASRFLQYKRPPAEALDGCGKPALGLLPFLPAMPILQTIKQIPGWLEAEEAEVLVRVVDHLLRHCGEEDVNLLEVGCFCGKASVAIGKTVQMTGKKAGVFALDTFDGRVGARDRHLEHHGDTRELFDRCISEAGLDAIVTPLTGTAAQINWSAPLHFLLIDGLHDYAGVACDYYHFGPHLVDGGWLLFHDYADYFPGVVTFADELLASGRFQKILLAGSLLVMQKTAGAAPRLLHPNAATQKPETAGLVSCIMPTADRSQWVADAVNQFLSQNFPNKELIVVDDGREAIGRLLPDHPSVVYIRLNERKSLGEKRNIACEAASGSIILHWDDDDWRHQGWISCQVKALNETGADITGLDRPCFFEPESGNGWQYSYPSDQTPWVYGATLCYTKQVWLSNPFPAIDIGEDNAFVWDGPMKKVVPHGASDLFLARIHRNNTSPKITADARWKRVDAARLPLTGLNNAMSAPEHTFTHHP